MKNRQSIQPKVALTVRAHHDSSICTNKITRANNNARTSIHILALKALHIGGTHCPEYAFYTQHTFNWIHPQVHTKQRKKTEHILQYEKRVFTSRMSYALRARDTMALIILLNFFHCICQPTTMQLISGVSLSPFALNGDGHNLPSDANRLYLATIETYGCRIAPIPTHTTTTKKKLVSIRITKIEKERNNNNRDVTMLFMLFAVCCWLVRVSFRLRLALGVLYAYLFINGVLVRCPLMTLL